MTDQESYTPVEVKTILANIIDRSGYDAGAICKWKGVDHLTISEWITEVNKMIDDHHEYGKRMGVYKISMLVEAELEKLNKA